MTSEDIEAFYTQINAIDFSNMESWDALPETLKSLGVNVPEKELEVLISDF
jgi:hypothetical protein